MLLYEVANVLQSSSILPVDFILRWEIKQRGLPLCFDALGFLVGRETCNLLLLAKTMLCQEKSEIMEEIRPLFDGDEAGQRFVRNVEHIF